MAKIGLRHAIAAPITGEVPGSALTYGTPLQFDPAMAANITFERSSTPLYGNDVLVENDNGITGGKISLNVTDLTDETQAGILGHTLRDSAYDETDASAPYVGFGYVRVKKRDNVLRYIGYWIHKVQFALNSDEAKTKGTAVEWQTPTVEGQIMGVLLDGTGNVYFRRHREFATSAEAEAWVDALAGLPVASVTPPVATPGAGKVTAGTGVTLACSTGGATIRYTTDGSTPNPGSMVYSAPVKVYEGMTLKAVAFKAGMNPSETLSATYTVDA